MNSNGGFNAEISGTDNDNNRNRSAASNDAPVMSRLEAGTDAKPWLFQVDLKSGEGIIELTDGSDPPRIFFHHFGNHCFEPDSLILESKEHDHWEIIRDKNSILDGAYFYNDYFVSFRNQHKHKKSIILMIQVMMGISGLNTGQTCRKKFHCQKQTNT